MMLASTINLSKDSSAASSGVTGIDFSVTLTTSNFDQPVTVQAPASAKPIQDLLTVIMGSGGLLSQLLLPSSHGGTPSTPSASSLPLPQSGTTSSSGQ